MAIIHACDLDGTLISGNSSFHLCLFLWRKKLLSFKEIFYCCREYALFCFQTSLRRRPSNIMLKLHQKVFSHLFLGWNAKNLQEHVDSFVEERVLSLLYLPVWQLLQAALERGERVLLISSSPELLVQSIAEKLGISEVFGTEYEIDEEGCLKSIHFLLDGEAKAEKIKRHFSMDRVIAYSDSIWDKAFLEAAQEQIVVQPDRHLKKIALINSWRII